MRSTFSNRGVKIDFDGRERFVQFNFGVIADLQERYQLPLISVMRDKLFIWSKDKDGSELSEIRAKTFNALLCTLLEDEREREKHYNGNELPSYTEKEVGWIIKGKKQADELFHKLIDAFNYDLSDPQDDDEDEDDDDSEDDLGRTQG